jgi:hypothetical protein
VIEAQLKGAHAEIVGNPDRFPNWTRLEVKSAAKWLPNFSRADVEFQLRSAGCDDPLVINTPARLRDLYPSATQEIAELCAPVGTHVRLKVGAPKSGDPTEGQEKRPVKEETGAPVKVKTQKKGAKKKAPKKKAAAKKAAPKKKAAKKKAAAKKAPAKKRGTRKA